MGLQFTCARVVSSVSTWGLKHVFRRPAANFPGKMALYVDPHLLENLAPKLAKGSFCVVGTNGKTTVTNLLADALEAAGERVVCNRTGANLDSGVATALLHAGQADWGVFECDELWLAKILPHLKASHVLLLNLFRDQLDRVGEVDRIQDSIVKALQASPRTTLIFNADDPLCTAIAERAGNPVIAFGVEHDMNLPQSMVPDVQMCHRCSAVLTYEFRQYGQLGQYECPSCGFKRPQLDSVARNVVLSARGLAFDVEGPKHAASLSAPFSGAYMAYNVLATFAAADSAGVLAQTLQQAINSFDPQNGRLQEFSVAGRRALLNLAKNPVGFDQNIEIVLQDSSPAAVAFFVNDKEGDGRDISWLWDIDFEKISRVPNIRVFAGGLRKNDVQLRLKYANINATLIDDAAAMLAQLPPNKDQASVYVIANYTALPALHAELSTLAQGEQVVNTGAPDDNKPASEQQEDSLAQAKTETPAPNLDTPATIKNAASDEPPLVIAHLFPELLNLYGDAGNVTVLEHRAAARGIPVEVLRVSSGERVDFSQVDLVFLSGGPEREQKLAAEQLMAMRQEFAAFVSTDGVVLAIDGGFQMLGNTWPQGASVVQGLGILDMTTTAGEQRLTGNSALRSTLASALVVGYENHAGQTQLGENVQALGEVVSSTGQGNSESDKREGAVFRNVVGSYLHGPLLPKNPEVADNVLARALQHRAQRTGAAAPELSALDDAIEQAAHQFVCEKLKVD